MQHAVEIKHDIQRPFLRTRPDQHVPAEDHGHSGGVGRAKEKPAEGAPSQRMQKKLAAKQLLPRTRSLPDAVGAEHDSIAGGGPRGRVSSASSSVYSLASSSLPHERQHLQTCPATPSPEGAREFFQTHGGPPASRTATPSDERVILNSPPGTGTDAGAAGPRAPAVQHSIDLEIQLLQQRL
ncbi:unnamed protein product, partial [Amoebophrya sp. A120]|eukprot:GSA120T00020980001.1